MSDRVKPCEGCGRNRAACWIMPCLHLEIVFQRGPRAVRRWGKQGGMVITRRVI